MLLNIYQISPEAWIISKLSTYNYLYIFVSSCISCRHVLSKVEFGNLAWYYFHVQMTCLCTHFEDVCFSVLGVSQQPSFIHFDEVALVISEPFLTFQPSPSQSLDDVFHLLDHSFSFLDAFMDQVSCFLTFPVNRSTVWCGNTKRLSCSEYKFGSQHDKLL